jgi:hypothetical protein
MHNQTPGHGEQLCLAHIRAALRLAMRIAGLFSHGQLLCS